jgi:hypothetical protein
MSLNWNIEKCANWKKLGTKQNWPVTNALIWATMAVQMGEITQRNFEEFYRRLNIIESKNGTFLNRPGADGEYEPYFITKADVVKRIGLRTNVGITSKSHFDAWIKKKALASN